MAAPSGNQNAANAAVAKAALERVLKEMTGVQRKDALEDIWRVQVEKALGGDNMSAQMIIERLDGKAKQAMAVAVTEMSHEEWLQTLS